MRLCVGRAIPNPREAKHKLRNNHFCFYTQPVYKSPFRLSCTQNADALQKQINFPPTLSTCGTLHDLTTTKLLVFWPESICHITKALNASQPYQQQSDWPSQTTHHQRGNSCLSWLLAKHRQLHKQTGRPTSNIHVTVHSHSASD